MLQDGEPYIFIEGQSAEGQQSHSKWSVQLPPLRRQIDDAHTQKSELMELCRLRRGI